jgi:hypothetical protein
VVEHRPVPGTADAQADRGEQARARARDQPRSRSSGPDSTDADQRAQDVPQIKWIDGDQMTEENGNDIEQPAIEVKVFEIEEALVGEAAPLIRNDQLTVVMLYPFIVGDGVTLESAQRDHDECGDQDTGGDIMSIEARYRPAPRQEFLRDAGNRRSGQLHLGHCTVVSLNKGSGPARSGR